MKKVLTLAGIGLFLTMTSCKKDYSCKCTTTDSNGDEIGSNTSTIENTTKSDAEAACNESDASFAGTTVECNIQ